MVVYVLFPLVFICSIKKEVSYPPTKNTSTSMSSFLSNLFDHFMSSDKYILCITHAASTVLSFVIYKLFISKSDMSKKQARQSEVEEYNEVLFFSEKNAYCYQHEDVAAICDSPECGLKKLESILACLEDATKTLDICVYTITYQKFRHIILNKFRAGVKVRVITDHGTSYGDGSQISEFRKNGVLVRARHSTFLMHHKFAIVDGTKLINGSLNWTSQGTSGNDENVLITSSPVIVKAYKEYFDNRWKELE